MERMSYFALGWPSFARFKLARKLIKNICQGTTIRGGQATADLPTQPPPDHAKHGKGQEGDN
jgi:hypothetical protein